MGNITAPAFNKRKMKNMVDDCKLIAKKNKIPFRWRYKVISNLDHNTTIMSKNAIPFLLEGLDY